MPTHTHATEETQPLQQDIQFLCEEYTRYNGFNPELYQKFNVKRGLRNADGTGVLAGITKICNVHGYVVSEGEKTPIDGELIYRGIDVIDLVNGCNAENRYSFEETVWLLLLGYLPSASQLEQFSETLAARRELPVNFTEDIIMKVASPNIMNMLSRSVLALYTDDPNPEDNTIQNVMRQSIELIARIPQIMAAAYQVKRRTYDGRSMYLHNPKSSFSTAQNILRLMRSDKQFTEEEARLLDLCLTLHCEHGGGNNSTFVVRTLTSAQTDTYSAIAAGIGSLKGARHGGANYKVVQQLDLLEKGVSNWDSDAEILEYLRRVVNKQAGDGSGLIYGMGHAVYTKSDPRSLIVKAKAMKMAYGTDFEPQFKLLDAIERLAPSVLREKRGDDRPLCCNIDLYSGLVYRMLHIPDELHTPLFAAARTVGWCAHRLEEICTGGKILRPAYKPIAESRSYVPLTERGE